ncbi:unnamed protein product [Urochloa humidicola]
MESRGLVDGSSSGLELTIAAAAPAGIDLNYLFESNGGGNVSSEENATAELALLNTVVNDDAPRGEEKADGVDAEGDAAGGGSLIVTRTHYRKLSKEQNDELEAAFQQANFIDKRTKEALAERLKITPKQVNVWFLNRRSRLRKQKNEEAYVQHKQQVEDLTKKNGRLQRKIAKLKERNKELKRKLKEATSTPKAVAPPPQQSPSVMVLPLPAGLSALAGLPGFESRLTDMAAATALNTQQITATAAALALPSPSAPSVPPSGGGGSNI